MDSVDNKTSGHDASIGRIVSVEAAAANTRLLDAVETVDAGGGTANTVRHSGEGNRSIIDTTSSVPHAGGPTTGVDPSANHGPPEPATRGPPPPHAQVSIADYQPTPPQLSTNYYRHQRHTLHKDSVKPGSLNPNIPISFRAQPAGSFASGYGGYPGYNTNGSTGGATMVSGQRSQSRAAYDTQHIPTGFSGLQKHTTPNEKPIQAYMLPNGYQPHPHDVMCGRGRSFKLWSGNQSYRAFVARRLDAYSKASTKMEKGIIISETVSFVRTKDPPGHFVKKDHNTNCFYEVGDFQAREKTSQAYRDALHEQYSSSAQAKYHKRRNPEAARYSRQTPAKVRPDSMLHLHPGDASVAQIHASLKAQEAKEKAESDSKSSTPLNPAPRMVAADTAHTWSSSSSAVVTDPATSVSKGEQPEDRRPIEDDVASVLKNMASTSSPTSGTDQSGEKVSVCALQLRQREPGEAPTVAAQHAADRMSTVTNQSKVDIFVLPELSPLGYSEDTFSCYLPTNTQNEDVLKSIDDIFAYQARRLNTFICYGTIGWKDTDDGSNRCFFIRQIVLDRAGKRVAHYDKIHLCDYGKSKETRFFAPGPPKPVSFSVGNFRFGILICADIRYAEMSRKLAKEHQIDAFLQPSAFVRDISYRSWKSFQETRAIENSCFFFAVNYAGSEYGGTSVVHPWVDENHEPETLGDGEGFLIGCVSREELDSVRTCMPFHRHLMSSDWKG